ncbi:hypothetical protein OAE37_00790, partial [Pirellulaceae bacterium]|nr:hypothetical protein [Pirellulaceae bacterium]
MVTPFFVLPHAVIADANGQEDGSTEKSSESSVSYFNQVRPIFQAKCQGCHQPAKRGGDYVMTNFAQLLNAGETGNAAIVPGKPDESYLMEQIVVDGDVSEMPKNAKPLLAEEIELIRTWITEG